MLEAAGAEARLLEPPRAFVHYPEVSPEHIFDPEDRTSALLPISNRYLLLA
jgi:hypothetical protein